MRRVNCESIHPLVLSPTQPPNERLIFIQECLNDYILFNQQIMIIRHTDRMITQTVRMSTLDTWKHSIISGTTKFILVIN